MMKAQFIADKSVEIREVERRHWWEGPTEVVVYPMRAGDQAVVLRLHQSRLAPDSLDEVET